MSKRVLIRNLNPAITSAGLVHLFGRYGTVVSARVGVSKATGRPTGIGHVEMGTGEEALAAIVGMDGRVVEGRTLFVS
jgi:RNA recognition motif-containing protein